MKVFNFRLSLALFIFFLVAGCKKGQEITTGAAEIGTFQFKSEKYGFSFSYPDGWEEITRDLPDRWALVDENKNTLLFIVNRAKTKDLLSLGRSQALRDSYDENKISDLKQDDIKKIFEIVKLESFNNRAWYTYGIKFSDKNVDSLISGTLCGDNEIMIVLVSDLLSFDKNKDAYTKMLSTLQC